MKATLLFVSIIVLQNSFSYGQSVAIPVDLKTEYLKNPIGIDAPQPRLIWRIDDNRTGSHQTAYRIMIGTDSLNLLQEREQIWNSEWVKSGSTLVRPQITFLKPFTRYFWRLEIEDQNNKRSDTPAFASFETGMMDQKNWIGEWVWDAMDKEVRPAPYFRKEFPVKKKIKSARVYITAAGLFELHINGKQISDHLLDPMYTRFDQRTLYVTHDVTKDITEGNNAIGVLLGNGWYNHQATAVWNFHQAHWRDRPSFYANLRIIYEDGSVETIATGNDWKTSESPLIYNSIYTGEHYDARLEQTGWNASGFNDSHWTAATTRPVPTKKIVSQSMHPVRSVEEVRPAEVNKINDTTYVFNLGRNISGITKFMLNGRAGTTIRLKHGERLLANGHVDMSNIDEHYRPTDNRSPFQVDIFTLSGKGEDTFTNHFNYKGFQYIEVTASEPVTLNGKNLTAYFLHSDVPVVGHVKSSNPVIDGIWTATNNSYLSNLFGYPTDCPQREKNGWTGDAQIAIETGLYGFDGITVYEKWMADHRDEQQPNGVLPSIIPTNGWGYEWGNGPDWTSTIVIIPWNIYLFYGDTTILSDNYENMKRYVDHIDKEYPTGLTSWGLGDWVPVKSKSPVELTSTCYYYHDAITLSRIAKLLGRKNDQERYDLLASKIKSAFNSKFYKPDSAIYGRGLQTELSAPLFWGLVPEDQKKLVVANLAKRVGEDQFHLDVGLLGQKAILNALSENGYADIAYKIASQETFPSWGWWIKNGATTLYENWDIKATRDLSLNHIMFGEIGAWLYKGPGGIKPDVDNPGFRNVILRPHFVAGLNDFETTHTGPQGQIKSGWNRAGNQVVYDIVVPPNSTATLHLPKVDGLRVYNVRKKIKKERIELMAGAHQFVWK